MKRICLALIALVALACSSVNAQEETSWFDLDHCAICKNMSDVKDLLPNIKWENHKIPNGMLSISVVPEAYKEKMETAHKGMEATIERLQGGERDMIILSLTSSDPEAVLREASFFFSPNRLNVSLTRARRKLVFPLLAGPMIPKISCSRIWRFTSRRTVFPPYPTEKSRSSSFTGPLADPAWLAFPTPCSGRMSKRTDSFP